MFRNLNLRQLFGYFPSIKNVITTRCLIDVLMPCIHKPSRRGVLSLSPSVILMLLMTRIILSRHVDIAAVDNKQ